MLQDSGLRELFYSFVIRRVILGETMKQEQHFPRPWHRWRVSQGEYSGRGGSTSTFSGESHGNSLKTFWEEHWESRQMRSREQDGVGAVEGCCCWRYCICLHSERSRQEWFSPLPNGTDETPEGDSSRMYWSSTKPNQAILQYTFKSDYWVGAAGKDHSGGCSWIEVRFWKETYSYQPTVFSVSEQHGRRKELREDKAWPKGRKFWILPNFEGQWRVTWTRLFSSSSAMVSRPSAFQPYLNNSTSYSSLFHYWMQPKISLWSVICLSALVLLTSLTACRAKEWRNLQRPPGQLRQLYEYYFTRGIPNKPWRRQVLEIKGMLYQRKHST